MTAWTPAGIRSLLLCIGVAGCHSVLPDPPPVLVGTVASEAGEALPGAVVRLQGTAFMTATDQAGHFELRTDGASTSKYVTAWKKGFYNGGESMAESGHPYSLVLKPLPQQDNPDYHWIPPRRPVTGEAKTQGKACSDCHPPASFPIVSEWENSAHAKSALNPLFLAFFSGSDESGPLIGALGYKRDFPQSNGSCATCHVPAMALHNPFDSDPRKAAGIEREGVFCDFCHKVEDVALDRHGGHPGVLAMRLKRPPSDGGMFFGPFDDVFPGPDSFNPLFKESRYCAACHDGSFWNVAVYSEFREWSESSYAKRNIHCQTCHMKPDGKTARFALEKEGSVLRDPATVASHTFNGIGDAAFMRAAVTMSAATEAGAGNLKLTVTVRNMKAGHSIPTGSPMRNMVLLVNAVDANGKPLEMLQGETVPEWAGMGPEADGNYAGLPGKGYAKVLKSVAQYQADSRSAIFTHLYPAPFWRPVVLDYDNRIAADGADISRYLFRLPEQGAKPVRVTTRLIYRKTFKSWLKPRAPGTDDLLLASESRRVP